jgi:23S rRNA (pseudouridine1915-N3)-methyltransferase
VRQVQILAVGKLKDAGLEKSCAEYYRRCRCTLAITVKEVRDLATLRAALPAQAVKIILDERGRQLTSLEFASQLGRWLEHARPLCLVVGGAEGLDEQIRAQADCLLSLGKMTFAHRLVRLVLAEQLYRAVSILEGSPYHREG